MFDIGSTWLSLHLALLCIPFTSSLTQYSSSNLPFDTNDGSESDSARAVDSNAFIIEHERNFLEQPEAVYKSGNGARGADTVFITTGSKSFNLTISKCALRWGQPVGRWVFFDGSTRNNATWKDIYLDACQHAGINGNDGQLHSPAFANAMNASLKTNIQSFDTESSGFLDAIVPKSNLTQCGSFTRISDEHEHFELRKLLQLEDLLEIILVVGVIGVTPTFISRVEDFYTGFKNSKGTEDDAKIVFGALWDILMSYTFAIIFTAIIEELRERLQPGVDQLMAAGVVALARREVLAFAMIHGAVASIYTEDTQLTISEANCSTCLVASVDSHPSFPAICGLQEALDAGITNGNASVLGIRPSSEVESTIERQKAQGACPALG